MRELVAPVSNFGSFDDIVSREVRRIGRVPGHDTEDLKQEARIAVVKALSRYDRKSTGRTFIAVAVRNKLINLKRNACTNGRVPRDAHGRLASLHSLDTPVPGDDGEQTWLDRIADEASDAEESASARELVRALDERLSAQEMSLLVTALVEGAKIGTARARGERVNAGDVDRVRATARDTIARLLGQRRMLTSDGHRVDTRPEELKMTTTKVTLPIVKTEELPDCHAALPTGPGYDPADLLCRDQCRDKFSCVRDLVNDRAKNEKGYTLAVDTEVQAVLSGTLSHDDAIARMKKRNAIVESGGQITDALSTVLPLAKAPAPAVKAPAAPPTLAPAAEPAAPAAPVVEAPARVPEPEPTDTKTSDKTSDTKTSEEDMGTKTSEEDMGTKKKAANKPEKAAKKKDAPPPPNKPETKPEGAPKRKGKAPIPTANRVAIYGAGKERWLPQPRALTEDQMAAALGRVRLGQSFDLAIGMEIVRKKRDGSEVVVKIAKDGFAMDGVTYPSLSAAGQWASRRAVSGNDFFNVEVYSCTEIRGKGVPQAVYSKQGEGKAAVVGAHVEKTVQPKKAAAPKAAKKATKKDAKKATKKAAKKATKKAAPPPPKAAKKATKKK